MKTQKIADVISSAQTTERLQKSNEPWKQYYKDVEGRPSKNYNRVVTVFRKANVRTVLDLGCGNGRHTIPLVKDGFLVYGFDSSRLAIFATKKKLNEENLNAEIIVWDMLKPLPYNDNFFDAVFASRVMYHTTRAKTKKIVNEVARVLKQNGYIYFEGPTYKKVTMSQLSLSHNLNSGYIYSDLKEVEPGTFLTKYPGSSEQSLYHVFKTREEVRQLFDDFRILQLDFRGRALRMLARKE